MSSAEYQRALDFIEAAEACANLTELRQTLAAALDKFGVPYFTLGAMLRERGGAPKFTTLIRGVTQEWSDYYWDQKCFNVDAAVHRAMQSAAPFAWSELEHQRLSRSSQRLFDEIREALKIGGGLVIPVHDESGFAGVIALHHDDPGLSAQQTAALKLIAIYGIECAKELHEAGLGRTPASPAPCPLSARQREILSYAAAGKSEADTGQILGIAGTTVRDHLERVRDVLGVRTKTQAVAVAVQRGWIVL
jgi:LuxR family quorum sensing-dependent transcriptional regulator